MVGTQKVTRCLITNQSHSEPKQMEQFSFGGSGVCVCDRGGISLPWESTSKQLIHIQLAKSKE